MTTATGSARSRQQEGSALVLALLLLVVVVGIVMSGSSILKTNRRRAETAFLVSGQAAEFARSGIVEAINWFRRQAVQPVMAFDPVLNASATPPILDTEDSDIGIMREFRINGSLWGRYEVWKRWDSDPDPARLSWRNRMRVEDISIERGRSTGGNVWRIRSIGYIYERLNGSVAFNVKPNRILATETLEAEISRLSIALPGQAALCARVGGSVTLKKNGRALGGSDAAGIFYPQGSGTPTLMMGSGITGSPTLSPSSVYDDSLMYVFGVNDHGMQTMADLYLEDGTDFPSPLPPASIIYVNDPSGWVTFTDARNLSGTGIVVVKGNVRLQPGSLSYFSGLLYIDGDLDMHAPFVMKGAFIVSGTVSVQGIGDFGDLVYDEPTLTLLRQTLASYRISRPMRRLLQAP